MGKILENAGDVGGGRWGSFGEETERGEGIWRELDELLLLAVGSWTAAMVTGKEPPLWMDE